MRFDTSLDGLSSVIRSESFADLNDPEGGLSRYLSSGNRVIKKPHKNALTKERNSMCKNCRKISLLEICKKFPIGIDVASFKRGGVHNMYCNF